MPATLIAEGIHVSYSGGGVLSGIDLTIEEGQTPLGLIGPSGVGKTTLIEVLSGHLVPNRGRVTFDGHDVTRKRGARARDFRASVRFVSQYSLTVLDTRETVAARLKEAAKVARRAGRTHHTPAEDLLAAAGLGPDFLHRRAITLSGGERQRLALATALATRPKILILDEPLTAVDQGARARLARNLGNTIERLGIGALVASHDLALITMLCPEVVFLAGGTLVARGPLKEMLATSEHPAIRDLAEYAELV